MHPSSRSPILLRVVVICLTTVLALALALPAGAHHRDAKQNKKINRLFDRTDFLSDDGLFFGGVLVTTECVNDDDARFYQDSIEPTIFFLDCESFQTSSQSVDAITANRSSQRHRAVTEFLRTDR